MSLLRHSLVAAFLYGVTSAAPAAQRLFPTDIVAVGETDVVLAFSFLSIKAGAKNATFDLEETREVEHLRVRAGVAPNLHIGASLPYYSRDDIDAVLGNTRLNVSSDSGVRNIQGWATYRFAYDEGRGPAFTGRLVLDTNTGAAGDEGVEVELAAGWQNLDTWQPYVIYTGAFRRDSDDRDVHTVSFGAYRALNNTVTFVPGLYYLRYLSTDSAGPQDQWVAHLGAQIQLGTSTFLLPELGYIRIGELDTKGIDLERGDGLLFSVGVYTLFGATY